MSILCAGEVVTEVDASLSAPKINKRQTNIEKQVTLEDQAICGALQTLNEEAMEDVLDERETEYLPGNELMANPYGYNSSNLSTCSDPAETDVLYLQTSVVPDLHFPALRHANSVFGSRALIGKKCVFIAKSLNVLTNISTEFRKRGLCQPRKFLSQLGRKRDHNSCSSTDHNGSGLA